MKTMLCAITLAASLGLARAQYADCNSDLACCQAAATIYVAPVVYQALAVYQGPVAYYAPVYYVSPPVADSCHHRCQRTRAPRSTVVVIGNGHPYAYSNRGCSGSTLVTIGSRYARRD